MVFVESAAFTRRLRELAGDNAEDVLSAIQDDLVANPQRGSVVQGLGGIRKARTGNPGEVRESAEGFVTGICFWSAAIISTCCFYSIRMSKKIWTRKNGPPCGEWSQS